MVTVRYFSMLWMDYNHFYMSDYFHTGIPLFVLVDGRRSDEYFCYCVN